MELANISVALDAKKVSIGSQQFEKNPEREKKYLFTNEGFAAYNKRLVYKKEEMISTLLMIWLERK